MLRIPRKASVIISTVLAYIILISMTVGLFFLPQIINGFIDKWFQQDKDSLNRVYILFVSYAILAFGILLDTLLLQLLRIVRKSKVFSKTSVAILRAISWVSMAIGILFILLFKYSLLFLAVGCVAFFVGLCLRVVKNCFEDAIEIKAENDLTV